ncbi:hypothetical protein ELI33_17165 [Rhizobium ruizarguesonis]|uniref:hypothetical protein n=1 Tax=Rhizobium ruizarguesonis TaxID=2081791 RepID=UPI001030EA88|nr:hypothetical protein [Rhizobium ruizarguesonis]TAV38818.1 hypothetical protein ELI33_17165 [Rhizobium ruizarguesonis]
MSKPTVHWRTPCDNGVPTYIVALSNASAQQCAGRELEVLVSGPRTVTGLEEIRGLGAELPEEDE